jgi:dynein regulatory complex subunit 2
MIQAHFQELKQRVNRFRDGEMKKLTTLTTAARGCIKDLEEKKVLMEKILQLAELNRKMETEREKILPFYKSTIEDSELVSEAPQATMKEVKLMHSYALGADGAAVEEWNYLDKFYKKFNKVLLDKFALSKEKEGLERQNEDLRLILKQYLDGVSVNEDGGDQLAAGPQRQAATQRPGGFEARSSLGGCRGSAQCYLDDTAPNWRSSCGVESPLRLQCAVRVFLN